MSMIKEHLTVETMKYRPIVEALEYFKKKHPCHEFEKLIELYIQSHYKNKYGNTPEGILRSIKKFFPESIGEIKEIISLIPELLIRKEEDLEMAREREFRKTKYAHLKDDGTPKRKYKKRRYKKKMYL